VKVFWTESALAQLQAIRDYLAQTSPKYALRIVDRLTSRSIQIATFPFSGRMVPEFELNEVREVIEGSYRIIYLIDAERQKVDVLAVIHSAREQLRPLGN
jgi:plasmid stabilization system protein ParE